jgi:hypothetical protein
LVTILIQVSGDRVSSPKGGFPGPLSPDFNQAVTGGGKMTPFTSEKQIRLYGELIVNFANAKNSDDARKKIIGGIEQAFNFSNNFIEETEKILPSLDDFKSKYSKQEKVLMRLVLVERNIKGFLNSQFGLINRKLIDYNSERNNLTFQDIIYHAAIQEGEIDGEVEFSKPYTMHIKEIEPFEHEMFKP